MVGMINVLFSCHRFHFLTLTKNLLRVLEYAYNIMSQAIRSLELYVAVALMRAVIGR